MEKRVKVVNAVKFSVGLDLLSNPAGTVVRPGSFIYMTEDDVAYNISRNSAFRDRLVYVDDEKEKEIMENNGIFPEEEASFISDEEITKLLNGSAKKLEEYLKTIDSVFVQNRVYDLAMNANLNMSKLKLLQKYMPDRTFIE